MCAHSSWDRLCNVARYHFLELRRRQDGHFSRKQAAPPAFPASGAPRKGRFPTGGTFHISPGVQRVSPVMGVSPRAENTRIISLCGATLAKERALSTLCICAPHRARALYPASVRVCPHRWHTHDPPRACAPPTATRFIPPGMCLVPRRRRGTKFSLSLHPNGQQKAAYPSLMGGIMLCNRQASTNST